MGVFCSELTVLYFKDKRIKCSFVQLVFVEYCVRHWTFALAARNRLTLMEHVRKIDING